MKENSGERMQPWDKGSILLDRRLSAGKPSSEEIKVIMSELIPELKTIASIRFANRGEERKLLRDLKGKKFDFERRDHFPISRPILCVSTLIDFVEETFIKQAKEALNEGNAEPLFRIFFDFAYGMLSPLAQIVSAEDEISGNQETYAKVTSKLGKLGASTTDQVEAYLRTKGERTRLAKSLMDDRSGLSIIDNFTTNIKDRTSPYVNPVQSSEYILAGAETVREMYKALYDITAPLYPEKPAK